MKTRIAVLPFILLAVVFLTALPASADMLIPGISFPLLEKARNMVKAGVTQLVIFESQIGGPTTAFYTNGFLVIPKDSFGLFADLSYVRIDPNVLNVPKEKIRAISTDVDAEAFSAKPIRLENGDLILCVPALQPDLYVITTAVTHSASTEVSSGLLATIGSWFGIKKHRSITTTDTVAAVIGVIDADDYIRTFADVMFGVCDPTKLTPEQKRLIRSAFYEQELRGTIEFSKPLPAYSFLSDAYARRVQGFPGAFESAGPSEAEKLLQKLQDENLALQKRLEDAEAAAKKAADEAAAAETERKRIEAEQEAARKQTSLKAVFDEIRLKYNGRNGFVFVQVGADGCPTGMPFNLYLWDDTAGGWKLNKRSPFVVSDGEGTWLWADSPDYKWPAIGVSAGPNVEPVEPIELHKSGLRIIAIPQKEGAEPYEVR